MKSSHLSLTQLLSCLAILLLAQSSVGQAIYCGNGNDFAGGPIIPDENERWEIFCNEAPEDHNITQGSPPGERAICRDCAPLVHGPTRAHTGGSNSCRHTGKSWSSNSNSRWPICVLASLARTRLLTTEACHFSSIHSLMKHSFQEAELRYKLGVGL